VSCAPSRCARARDASGPPPFPRPGSPRQRPLPTLPAPQTYGAFIDIGATSDGLAHVSELSAAFVKDPKDILTVGQEVDARVLSVDADKGRFALSLKKEGETAPARGDGEGRQQRRGKVARAPKQKKVETTLKVGETVTGKVARVLPYGAFIVVQEGVEGLLHQSEVATTELEPNLKAMFKEDQEVEVRVISVDNNKVSLTTKSEEERKPFKGASAEIDPSSTKTLLEYQMARLGLKSDMFPKASA